MKYLLIKTNWSLLSLNLKVMKAIKSYLYSIFTIINILLILYVVTYNYFIIISAFKKHIRCLTTLKYDVQNIHTRIDVLETLLEKIDGKLPDAQTSLF